MFVKTEMKAAFHLSQNLDTVTTHRYCFLRNKSAVTQHTFPVLHKSLLWIAVTLL